MFDESIKRQIIDDALVKVGSDLDKEGYPLVGTALKAGLRTAFDKVVTVGSKYMPKFFNRAKNIVKQTTKAVPKTTTQTAEAATTAAKQVVKKPPSVGKIDAAFLTAGTVGAPMAASKSAKTTLSDIHKNVTPKFSGRSMPAMTTPRPKIPTGIPQSY